VISVSIKLLGTDTLCLRVGGTLDVTTVVDLEPTLATILRREPWHVQLELSRLRMIDSVGVGALLGFYKRLQTCGCWVTLKGLREQPLAVFRLLGLDRALGMPGLNPLSS